MDNGVHYWSHSGSGRCITYNLGFYSFFNLNSNMLQMMRGNYCHVSFRWACLWISLYVSSLKSNLPLLVIVSFNTEAFMKMVLQKRLCDILSTVQW